MDVETVRLIRSQRHSTEPWQLYYTNDNNSNNNKNKKSATVLHVANDSILQPENDSASIDKQQQHSLQENDQEIQRQQNNQRQHQHRHKIRRRRLTTMSQEEQNNIDETTGTSIKRMPKNGLWFSNDQPTLFQKKKQQQQEQLKQQQSTQRRLDSPSNSNNDDTNGIVRLNPILLLPLEVDPDTGTTSITNHNYQLQYGPPKSQQQQHQQQRIRQYLLPPDIPFSLTTSTSKKFLLSQQPKLKQSENDLTSYIQPLDTTETVYNPYSSGGGGNGIQSYWTMIRVLLFEQQGTSSIWLLDYALVLNFSLFVWILYLSIPKRFMRKVIPNNWFCYACYYCCATGSKRRYRKQYISSQKHQERHQQQQQHQERFEEQQQQRSTTFRTKNSKTTTTTNTTSLGQQLTAQQQYLRQRRQQQQQQQQQQQHTSSFPGHGPIVFSSHSSLHPQQQQLQQQQYFPQNLNSEDDYDTNIVVPDGNNVSIEKSTFDDEFNNDDETDYDIVQRHENQQRLLEQHQQRFQTLTSLSSDGASTMQNTFSSVHDNGGITSATAITNANRLLRNQTSSTVESDSIFMLNSSKSSENDYTLNVSLPNYYGGGENNNNNNKDRVANYTAKQIGLKKDTIPIVRDDDSLPFDINNRASASRNISNIKNINTVPVVDVTREVVLRKHIGQLHDNVLQATEHVRRKREQRHADFVSNHGDEKKNITNIATGTLGIDNNNNNDYSPILVGSIREYSPERLQRRTRLAAIQQIQQQQLHTSYDRPTRNTVQVPLNKRRSLSSSPIRSDVVRDAMVSELLREKTRRYQQKGNQDPSLYLSQHSSMISTSSSVFDPFGLNTGIPNSRIDKSHTTTTILPRRKLMVGSVDSSSSPSFGGRQINMPTGLKNEVNISTHSDTRHNFLTRLTKQEDQQQQANEYISPPTSISNSSGDNSGTRNMMPSPAHPSTAHSVPNDNIVLETMKRMQSRGVRLLAHGIHVVEPKRVWIKYVPSRKCIEWQSENPRKIISGSATAAGAQNVSLTSTPSSSSSVSIVLVRGALHTIPLSSILYIDVGQKTLAFLKPKGSSVKMPTASMCFSLLTNDGSLDLQANSKTERDALVSCLCWIADYTQGNTWRRLYEESSAAGTGDKKDISTVKNYTTINDASSVTSQLHQHYTREIYAPLSVQIHEQITAQNPDLQEQGDEAVNYNSPQNDTTYDSHKKSSVGDPVIGATAKSILASNSIYMSKPGAAVDGVIGSTTAIHPSTFASLQQSRTTVQTSQGSLHLQESSGSSYSGISTAIISLSAEEI